MEERVYATNYISEVILRVDFNKAIAISSENLRAFKDRIKRDVEYKEDTVTRYEMKFDKDNPSFNMVNIGKSGTYVLKDEEAKFVFDHEKFLLTSNKYQRFSSFYSLYKTGLSIMLDILAVNEFKRLGLRYINCIELGSIQSLSDWKSYVNSDFIPDYSKIRIGDSDYSLRRNMNAFIFRNAEYTVNLNIGIWNREFPSIISSDKSIIVDIDCYIDNVLLNKDEIQNKPEKMNLVTVQYFESLITDKLREHMETK